MFALLDMPVAAVPPPCVSGGVWTAAPDEVAALVVDLWRSPFRSHPFE